MQKWEYCQVRYSFPLESIILRPLVKGSEKKIYKGEQLPEVIGWLGEAGWELVNYVMSGQDQPLHAVYTFKRPIESP